MKITEAEIEGKKFKTGPLNVIVGKNNSGKSTLLKELYATSRTTVKSASGNKWVNCVGVEIGEIKQLVNSMFSFPERLCEVRGLSAEEAFRYLKPRSVSVAAQGQSSAFHGSHLASIESSAAYESNQSILVSLYPGSKIKQTSDSPDYIVEYIVDLAASVCVRSELCDIRLAEPFKTNIDNVAVLEQTPTDQMAKLFCDPDNLKVINETVQKVFGFRVGFDDIRQSEAFLRILPESAHPRKWESEIEKSHWWENNSPLICDQGDGIKAFLKLLITLQDDTVDIVFIDEPETFLHPPQRRAIGEAIVVAAAMGKQVFVATHDADVVRGLLTGSLNPEVIYLNVTDKQHTIENINLTSLVDCGTAAKSISKNGVQMLNEKVINSLFFDKTVLVESENDRLIYELFCQQRLYSEYQGRCFIGLHGSDTVLNLFDLMKASGMSVCCIVDLDFLLSKDLSSTFVNSLNPKLREKHVSFSEVLHERRDYSDIKKRLKSNGLDFLEGEELDIAKKLIDSYSEYGIYIVPAGELESWFDCPGKNGISSMVSQIQNEENRFDGLTSFLWDVID